MAAAYHVCATEGCHNRSRRMRRYCQSCKDRQKRARQVPDTGTLPRYDTETKVVAVVASKVAPVGKVAKAVGVSLNSVSSWRHGKWISEEDQEMAKITAQEMADRAEEIAGLALNMIPGKLDDASARECSSIHKELVTSAALLRGDPTEINKNISDEEAVLARIKARAAEAAEGAHP